MSKLLTSKEIKKKHGYNRIYLKHRYAFRRNVKKLKKFFFTNKIIEEVYPPPNHDKLKELIISLRHTVLFLEMSEAERLQHLQQNKSFWIEFLRSRLKRIDFLLEDEELGKDILEINRKGVVHINKDAHDLSEVFKRLKEVRRIIKSKLHYWERETVAGHLLGIRIAMTDFFGILHSDQVKQVDQIKICRDLIHEFNAQWTSKLEDNIRVSLQQPAVRQWIKEQKEEKKLWKMIEKEKEVYEKETPNEIKWLDQALYDLTDKRELGIPLDPNIPE